MGVTKYGAKMEGGQRFLRWDNFDLHKSVRVQRIVTVGEDGKEKNRYLLQPEKPKKQ